MLFGNQFNEYECNVETNLWCTSILCDKFCGTKEAGTNFPETNSLTIHHHQAYDHPNHLGELNLPLRCFSSQKYLDI